jgi:hypothetical protein
MNSEAQRHAMCCELVHDVARSAGVVRLKVAGISMLPSIWPGDVVTVRHQNFSELKSGEIVLFRQDGSLTLHRIRRIMADRVITRGDTLSCDDRPVRDAEIVGKLVSIDRRGRRIELGRPVWQRLMGLLLQRSDLSMRVVLGVRARLWCRSDASVSPCG